MKKGGVRVQTVAAKVQAVLALHRAQRPGVHLSISALARAAGVSRANLYASHSELIASMKAVRQKEKPREDRSPSVQTKRLREEIARLKRVNKALLLLNMALRQEVARLARRTVR